MRLFLAISVPEAIKGYLESIPVPGKRVSAYHLTLAFLGDGEPGPAIQKLKGIGFSSMALELDGMGCFPNSMRPRVVWVGLKRNEELTKLQMAIAEALDVMEKFYPHITLSRLRRPQNIILREIEPMSFDAGSFELFSSTLTPQGPVYAAIKTFKSTCLKPGYQCQNTATS